MHVGSQTKVLPEPVPARSDDSDRSSATFASVFSLNKCALAIPPGVGILATLPKLLHALASAVRSHRSRAPRRWAVRFGGGGGGEEEVERLPNISLKDESTGLGARKVKGAAG